MQLHLDGSCNHWFAESSQFPVDSGTCKSRRQNWSRSLSKERDYHNPWHLWISFLPVRPSNGINRVSLTTGIAATHIPESIGCSPRCQPVPALATRLGQGPVRYGGPATHWSFYVVGRISALNWAPGLCHLSTLQRRWRDSRAPGAIVSSSQPGPVRHLATRKV